MYLENDWLMTFFSSVTIKVHLTSSTMESAIQGKLTPCSQTPFNPIWLRILSLLFPLEQNLWLVLKFKVYSPAALKVGQALIILWNTEDKHGGERKKEFFRNSSMPCTGPQYGNSSVPCHVSGRGTIQPSATWCQWCWAVRHHCGELV